MNSLLCLTQKRLNYSYSGYVRSISLPNDKTYLSFIEFGNQRVGPSLLFKVKSDLIVSIRLIYTLLCEKLFAIVANENRFEFNFDPNKNRVFNINLNNKLIQLHFQSWPIIDCDNTLPNNRL